MRVIEDMPPNFKVAKYMALRVKCAKNSAHIIHVGCTAGTISISDNWCNTMTPQ